MAITVKLGGSHNATNPEATSMYVDAGHLILQKAPAKAGAGR